jgi:hypothetical protein
MPTQTELEFRSANGGQTQNARLKALFESRPGEWMEMTDLGRQIGAWAVHSRVADLRRKHGMDIQCRTRVDQETRQRLSSYCYLPPSSSALN